MAVVRRAVLTIGTSVALAVSAAGPGALGLGDPTAVDLSSVDAIERYLLSIGVDPSTAIFQEAPLNYAGPDCPGIGWTCADSDAPVVQTSKPGGKNTFHCSPPASGTDPSANRCVVVQVSVTGENNAKCIMKDDGEHASQECSITQQNSRGNNHAQAHLTITQNGMGSAQSGDQQVSITQANESGNNSAHTFETVTQSLQATGAGGADLTQDQNAHLAAVLDQDSTSGNNASFIHQALDQKADAKGAGAITQRQNATDGPDLEADVDQDSDSGRNDSQLRELIDQFASASSAPGPVTQTQGSESGGSDGSVDQFSSGVATAENLQHEEQTLKSQVQGSLSQTQFGPQRCCTFQLDNPNNRFTIDQVSVQTAGEDAQQFNEMEGTCVSSGTCTVNQRVTQNGETTENSCQGNACIILCLLPGLCITLDIPPGEELGL